MADQYGRDERPPGGAYQPDAIGAVAEQYPEMATDLQMMMQGAQNDIDVGTGALGVGEQPGLEQMLQQALARTLQGGEELNGFQRFLQIASSMPGLTGDPAGAGILSLLMAATDTPFGSRGGGGELRGLGSIMQGLAGIGKMKTQQRQQEMDELSMNMFGGVIDKATAAGDVYGPAQMPQGVGYRNPRTGWSVEPPNFGTGVNEQLENYRQQNRGGGTPAAPGGGGGQGTGTASPVYDAEALAQGRATGMMPAPMGMTPVQQTPMGAALLSDLSRKEAEAEAKARATKRGMGTAEQLGEQPLPNTASMKLADVEKGMDLLNQLEEMYLGKEGRAPWVPGVETSGSIADTGSLIWQSMENTKNYFSEEGLVKAAEDARTGLAILMARANGETGNPSNIDIKNALALLPSMHEALSTRRAKIAVQRRAQQTARDAILGLQGRIPGVRGGGFDRPVQRRSLGAIEEVR